HLHLHPFPTRRSSDLYRCTTATTPCAARAGNNNFLLREIRFRPILRRIDRPGCAPCRLRIAPGGLSNNRLVCLCRFAPHRTAARSEEHTSELESPCNL